MGEKELVTRGYSPLFAGQGLQEFKLCGDIDIDLKLGEIDDTPATPAGPKSKGYRLVVEAGE